MQKTLGDVAKHYKRTILMEIPENYSIKPVFKNIANEKTIRSGVLVFRDFMQSLYGRLIADSSKYYISKNESPEAKDSINITAEYPFLSYIKNVLTNVGYYGELNKNKSALLVTDWQLLTTISVPYAAKTTKAGIPPIKLIETLKFLTLCGIKFDGIDLNEKKPDVSSNEPIIITYPENPLMLTGLKVFGIAQKEFQNMRNDDILLRCDYTELIDGDTDPIPILNENVKSLPLKTQKFVLNLHKRYISAGLTCNTGFKGTSVEFAYMRKNKIIFEFVDSLINGYQLIIKAKKIQKHSGIINTFSPVLQKKIAGGYGCFKKMGKSRCLGDCRGFRFPLDDSILKIGKDIETWLDLEVR